jgi:protein-S-isoprenylcysteine O-methyltransferase Ste14
MKADADSAHVPVPPPLMALVATLMGVGLQFLRTVHFISGLARWLVGGVLLGIGIGTILRCAWMFRKAQTAIEPWKTTTFIVQSGPYRWSRNPIYVSFLVVGIGIAFLTDNLWIALMQVFLMVVIRKVVIQREERYLEGKFGDSYRAYKNQVRRWL